MSDDVAAAALKIVVQAINNKLQLADEGERKARSYRLEAGRMLVDLRRRIEAEGGDWWKWQEGKFKRSRKDIEKLLRLEKADDPEAAEATERAKNAEQQRKFRAKRNGADVSSKPEPPADEMPTEEEADESWQNDLYDQACLLLERMGDVTRARFIAHIKRASEPKLGIITGKYLVQAFEYALRPIESFCRENITDIIAQYVQPEQAAYLLPRIAIIVDWLEGLTEKLATKTRPSGEHPQSGWDEKPKVH